MELALLISGVVGAMIGFVGIEVLAFRWAADSREPGDWRTPTFETHGSHFGGLR
jgi:hypothetical protein